MYVTKDSRIPEQVFNHGYHFRCQLGQEQEIQICRPTYIPYFRFALKYSLSHILLTSFDAEMGAAPRRRGVLRLVLLVDGRDAERRGGAGPGDHDAGRVLRAEVLRVPQDLPLRRAALLRHPQLHQSQVQLHRPQAAGV